MDPSSHTVTIPDTFAERVITYLSNLAAPAHLPAGVDVINPYQRGSVRQVVTTFYTKFFSDNQHRVFILGINPGRFGAGVTGIGFTDPIALKQACGIPNTFEAKHELSSRFVYRVIERFGGPEAFYSHFYLSSLYPLALVKDGKNYNYYDAPALYTALKPAMVANVRSQLEFGGSRARVICLGRKNGDYLKRVNDEHGFFDQITIVDHPRYVMQYKLRQMEGYVEQYQRALTEALD